MKSFENKTVVVTGAGSGIGKALALNFADLGSNIAICDINEENLQITVSEVRKRGVLNVYSRAFDVSKSEEMHRFASEVNDKFSQVDVMINNAGVALGVLRGDSVPLDAFEWLMGINFWGMVYGTQAFMPLLKQSKEACLVNISSILGIGSIAFNAPYCSSKFAIRGYTESLRMESMLEYPHVNILSVHPGGIQTNIAQAARTSDNDFTQEQNDSINAEMEKSFINTPDYAAQAIIKAIKKRKKKLLIGRDAKLMNAFVRFFPTSYTKHFIRMFGKPLKMILEKS